MEDWAEIRRLRRVEGMAISAIARRLGIARNTVKKALVSDGPPKYVREPKGSIVDAVEPAVRELLRKVPDMPATVIAERLLRAAGDHVQQPCRAAPVADRGQIDDHGDVLVTSPGVSPHVLIDADDLHAVKAVRVLDQDALAFGQHGAVGGVPGDRQGLGDPCDRQVADHQSLQRPPQATTGELRARFGRAIGVLTPHVGAPGAAVAAHRDLQDRGSPPQRFVREPAGHRVPGRALAPAAPTPLVRIGDPAGQDRTIGLEPLPHDHQAELVQPGERSQVRTGEGSVRHVEVFPMGSVRTPIIGRPRPLPPHRRAHPTTPSSAKSP